MTSQSWVTFETSHRVGDFSICLGKLKLECCEHANTQNKQTKKSEELHFMMLLSLGVLIILKKYAY